MTTIAAVQRDSKAVLTGGGIFGAVQAALMAAFEQASGLPFFKSFPGGVFCTSVGAINGASVWPLRETGKPVVGTSKLNGVYLNRIADAFRKRWLGLGGVLGKYKYDTSNFEDLLEETFGDIRLSEFDDGLNIIVYDLANNKIRVLSSQKATQDKTEDFYIRDVLRAAMNAPYFFEMIPITNMAGEECDFADAGIVNKDFTDGACEAAEDKENLVLTTFATGHRRGISYTVKDLGRGIRSLSKLATIQIDHSANRADRKTRNALDDPQYTRLDVDIGDSDVDMVSRKIEKVTPYAEKAVRENALNGVFARAVHNIHGPNWKLGNIDLPPEPRQVEIKLPRIPLKFSLSWRRPTEHAEPAPVITNE